MDQIAPAVVHATLSQWVLADGLPIVCDLERSQGPYLRDARTGVDYLDFFSFFSSRPLGFNHPRLVEPQFLKRLAVAALHKPANCDAYTTDYAEFVDVFARVALGSAFAHLFFIEGGGPAVDNAVKAAIDWKHRKNEAAGRASLGSQIIHFRRAFHGRTGYALSLTDPFDQRKTRFFPIFKWPRIAAPTMRFPFDFAARADVEAREEEAAEAIFRAFDEHEHDVAAIIVEPVQCEGGDNYFRREFLERLRRIANEREALLIFDEVQTGFGTTGRWWDWQHHGVKPDLLVFGKKAQVCGFAATDRLDDVESVFHVPSRISSTFSGNLVDMVRCRRVIEIVTADHLLDHASAMGAYMLQVLSGLAQSHAEITGVRGRGLLAAFDLPATAERDRLVEACMTEQLLVLPCGERSVRLRPALDIQADAIGRAGAQLEAAICRAYGRPR